MCSEENKTNHVSCIISAPSLHHMLSSVKHRDSVVKAHNKLLRFCTFLSISVVCQSRSNQGKYLLEDRIITRWSFEMVSREGLVVSGVHTS